VSDAAAELAFPVVEQDPRSGWYTGRPASAGLIWARRARRKRPSSVPPPVGEGSAMVSRITAAVVIACWRWEALSHPRIARSPRPTLLRAG
jgi:hypothetical protein